MIDFKYAERLSETIMKNTMGNAGRFDRPMIEDFDNQRDSRHGHRQAVGPAAQQLQGL